MKTVTSVDVRREAEGLKYMDSLRSVIGFYKDNIGKSVEVNMPIPDRKKAKKTIWGILKNVYSKYITIETDKGITTATFHDIITNRITIKINKNIRGRCQNVSTNRFGLWE